MNIHLILSQKFVKSKHKTAQYSNFVPSAKVFVICTNGLSQTIRWISEYTEKTKLIEQQSIVIIIYFFFDTVTFTENKTIIIIQYCICLDFVLF